MPTQEEKMPTIRCQFGPGNECTDPMECVHWGREGCVKESADDLFHRAEARGSRPHMEDEMPEPAIMRSGLREAVRMMIDALHCKPVTPMGRC